MELAPFGIIIVNRKAMGVTKRANTSTTVLHLRTSRFAAVTQTCKLNIDMVLMLV